MGDDDSGSTPTPTQTAPWKPQRDQLEYLFTESRNEYDRGMAAPEMPQSFAGPNDSLNSAWNGVENWAGSNTVSEDASAGWGDLLASMDVANNPLVQRQIGEANDQMMQDFMQQVIPGINNQAVGAGQVGSSRHGMVQGMATQGLADAMQESSTNIMRDAYAIGSENVRAAVNAGNSMYNLNNADNILLGQVAQDRQAYDQAYLDDQYARRVQEEQRRWDLLSNYKAMISGGYGGTTTPQDESGGSSVASMATRPATLPAPSMYQPQVPGMQPIDMQSIINAELQSGMVDPQGLYNPPLTN